MESSTQTNENPSADATALAWTQETFVDQITRLLPGKHLNIMEVDTVIGGLNGLREALQLPAHRSMGSVAYRGLRLLHCKDYEKMSPNVRQGIPAALLSVLGLTDQQAPALLGDEGWALVKSAFEAWTEGAAVYKPAA